jgi:hypothetical protein
MVPCSLQEGMIQGTVNAFQKKHRDDYGNCIDKVSKEKVSVYENLT